MLCNGASLTSCSFGKGTLWKISPYLRQGVTNPNPNPNPNSTDWESELAASHESSDLLPLPPCSQPFGEIEPDAED
jgi:hypothetical protein